MGDRLDLERRRRQWLRRDLPLYVFAILSYVAIGAFVFKLIFNWIAGPVYILLIVHWIPTRLRRRRERKRTACA